MVNIVPKNLGAAGYIIILEIVILAFFGLTFIGSQIQSVDLKQVVIQANETAYDTNIALKEGTQRTAILNEVRNISNDIAENFSQAEKGRLNQTKFITPLFQRQFVQVDKLVNATDDLRTMIPSLNATIKNVTTSIMYLSQNFGEDSTYLDRENQQYVQANKTFAYLNQSINEIKEILNNSMQAAVNSESAED